MAETFQIGIKALILNDRKEILILKAGERETKFTKVDFWDLPGGRMEKDSNITETLEREIEEELGVPGKSVEIIGIFHAGTSNFLIHLPEGTLPLMLITYICSLKTNDRFVLSDEHADYKWATVDEAKDLLKTKFGDGFIEALDQLK